MSWVVFFLIINMSTVKHFGLSAMINLTQARNCQDAYGKFPVLDIVLGDFCVQVSDCMLYSYY